MVQNTCCLKGLRAAIGKKMMKRIFEFFNLIVFITMMAVVITSCNSSTSSSVNKTDELIDSLIQIEKLTDQTIIMRFGGEAVTAILTQEGIVVVDAGMAAGLTSHYRKLIEKEFHRNDVAMLFITHGHHDHFGGSSVFNDATVVAHEHCKNAMATRWQYPEKVKSNLQKIINEYDRNLDNLDYKSEEWFENFEMRVRFQSAYEDIMNNRQAKLPDITFTDTLSIKMGDISFHMIWFGKAHSESDILIHVPELKLLFTGDLFSKYGRPSMDDLKEIDLVRFVMVRDWTIARMDNIRIIIGGHGQILSKEDLLSFYQKIQH